MADKPEQKARREIAAHLKAAGWIVQDKDDLDLTAGRGIAVREFAMKPGSASPITSSMSSARRQVASRLSPRAH